MSYLGSPFQHDLFVSYSHGDVDGSGQSDLKAWSQAFARELEKELKLEPGFGDVQIFLDQPSLDRMAPLSEQLEGDIAASGLLTVLMSPHYLKSNWCGQERDWWRKAQAKHGLPPDGRIAVAHIWPTDDPWPDGLVDRDRNPLVGFDFYDKTKAGRSRRPYEWPDPTGAKGPFKDELIELVGAIVGKLEDLKGQLEERRRRAEGVARLAASRGQVIYLHGREEQAEVWQRAGKALDDEGFIVLPTEPDPVGRHRVREIGDRRVETLIGCDGLLLLGTEDGRALEADLVVIGRQDLEEARARTERPLPCGVLDTAGAALATSDRKGLAGKLGVQWIEATGGAWPTHVKSWLNEASAVPEHA